MLKKWIKEEKPSDEEVKARLEVAGGRLAKQQILIKEHKIPVIVLVEGWGASGKGSMVGKLINDIDPRFFKVASMSEPTPDEKRYPFLHRYFVKIPEAGKFLFLDSGWASEVVKQKSRGDMSESLYESRIESIKRFERQLTDNGYLVLKFFLHISKKEQKKRLTELEENEETAWRVSSHDKWQNKNYEENLEVYDRFLTDTNVSGAPWYIVDGKDKKWALLQVLETMCDGIDVALQNESIAVPLLQNTFPLVKMPELSEVKLDKTISDENYKLELKELQKRLRELHYSLYRRKIPVVIAYEGWDAAGKGGNIKRIAGALDARGYEVHPISSPEPHEKARHYLWRFWNRLPKTGHIAIFDRTWYGRVMVERLEGFCSPNDWQRAYNEINEFEKELSQWGAVIIKFWVQIDKDTQLERFTDRQNTPEKQWKITDEDWRNREKWDDYEKAVNEMIKKTSTAYAPWHILESVDKKYARIKALKIVINELEKVIGDIQ